MLLERTPLGGASDAELIDYYGGGRDLTLSSAGLVVMPFAGVAFLWFMVALRAAVGKTALLAGRAPGHVQQASGLIFVALLFAGTAALVAMPISIRFAGAGADPIVARMLPTLGVAVLLLFPMRMAAMLVFTTSSIGRATGLLPGLVRVARRRRRRGAGLAYLLPRRSAAILDRADALLTKYNRWLVIALGLVFGTWFLVKALSGFGII